MTDRSESPGDEPVPAQIEIDGSTLHDGAAHPVVPQVQYFQPPGPYLPPVRWRQRQFGWVWVISTVVVLALIAASIAALTMGFRERSTFDASGAVHVDCATRVAVDGQPIGPGAQVRLYDAKNGDLLQTTTLDDFVNLEAGHGACFLRFAMADIKDVAPAYLIEIGSAPGELVSRADLESGSLLYD